MSAQVDQPGLIGAMWRYRWSSLVIVAALALLAGAAGWVLSPAAEARGSIALSTPPANNVLSPGTVGDASQGRYTSQRAQYAESDAVLNDVAERLGRGTPPELRRLLTVTPSPSNNTLLITAEGDDTEEALELATALIDAYATQTQQQVEELTIAAIESIRASEAEVRERASASNDQVLSDAAAATISQLALQASEIETSSALLGDGVEFVKAPTEESVDTRPLPLRELALGMIVGLAIAGTVAWLRADSDRRIASAVQAERALEAPVLTEVRRGSDIALDVDVDLTALPSFYYQLAMAGLSRNVTNGIVVVTGPKPATNSAAALNLAVAAARDGGSVLLVDGAAGQGGLSTSLAVAADRPGVTDVVGGADWRDCLQPVEVDVGRGDLAFLPAGGRLETGRSSQKLGAATEEWRSTYALVVIAGATDDSGVQGELLVAAADEAVLVVPRGSEESRWLDVRRRLAVLRTGVAGFIYVDDSAPRTLPRRWLRRGRTTA